MPDETLKPKIIAHRGASGYLPEHTLESKLVAHWQGADYLEQDVVATRDGELVVFHDIYLDPITDVESLSKSASNGWSLLCCGFRIIGNP